MRKLRNSLLFAISFFYLTNCTAPPPDVFVFKHLKQRIQIDPGTGHLTITADPICLSKIQEMECCYGVSIVSGSEVFIGEREAHWFKGKACSTLVEQSILMPAVESYAPMATYIINQCAKMHCSAQVDAFKIKLDSINGVGGALSNP